MYIYMIQMICLCIYIYVVHHIRLADGSCEAVVQQTHAYSNTHSHQRPPHLYFIYSSITMYIYIYVYTNDITDVSMQTNIYI